MTHLIESEAGTITIPASTLANVVTAAAESIDGVRVRRRRGLHVDVAAGSASVRVELSVRYGTVLPAAGASVQDAVADVLERTCGLRVESVDVCVEELE